MPDPNEVEQTVRLPGSASDPAPSAPALGAYIRNPIFDKPKITALEAIDTISLFASVLAADGAYRASVADGRVFNVR